MANIQKQITAFDETIRLKRYDENVELREKRDTILDRLRNQFKAMRKEGKEVPTFSEFNQGSYQMGTGIQPAEGDYDIDVGLRFDVKKTKYPNPVDLKVLVADALEDHTELGTDVRRSCVTVKYKKEKKQAFHVDLAVYAYEDPEADEKKLFLAKGKRGSDAENRRWEESDPLGLIERIDKRFPNADDQAQFLRVIRLLKRWKTEKFDVDGNGAPTGIGITIAADALFAPVVVRDLVAKTQAPDDRKAMSDFIDATVNRFNQVAATPDGTPQYRLTMNLPVAPRNDIFEKMTDDQMTTFRERLIALRDALEAVRKEPDPIAACKRMQSEFGKNFPVPSKEETAEPRRRAVVSSGVSA